MASKSFFVSPPAIVSFNGVGGGTDAVAEPEAGASGLGDGSATVALFSGTIVSSALISVSILGFTAGAVSTDACDDISRVPKSLHNCCGWQFGVTAGAMWLLGS